jgi:capsid protein
MPFNVAAANSSEYNYASGRLDWQVYFRMIRTVRAWIVEHLLDRVFFTWLREAQLITAMRLPPIDSDRLMTQWFWPGSEHVDPMKEAGAQNLRLRSFNTNLAAEHAAQGRDWEREVRQWGKEVELLKGLGLYELYVAMLTTSVAPVVIGEGEQEEEETTKEKTNAKSE